MPDEDPGDLIQMTHPGLKDTAPSTTTVRAFDKIWSGKGWKRANADDITKQAEAVANAEVLGEPQKPTK